MTSIRPGPSPIDRVSDSPPDSAEWRADAMAQSRHSRLDDVFIEPLEDHDVERAALVCGEVTRNALRDFAPALVLLPASERRRLQAVAAFGLTLFDFARQSGLEGERLSQMNRWHYDLEATLDGEGPGQPVFVLLAAAEKERPWPRAALDDLVGCGRRRAIFQRPESPEAAVKDALRLGNALGAALLGDEGAQAAPLAATLLRTARLLALGDDSRRHQAGLAVAELPEIWGVRGRLDSTELSTAVRRECERLTAELANTDRVKGLPRAWRRAATYAVIAARRLVQRTHALGGAALEQAPKLGALERIGLVLRSLVLPY